MIKLKIISKLIYIYIYRMDNINKPIIAQLLKNKPNLSKGTITTYTCLIRNMFFKLKPSGTKFDIDVFNDYKAIMNLLKDKEPKTRKTYLATIITLLGKQSPIVANLSAVMFDDAKISKEEDESQLKNDKQEKNSITEEEIKQLFINHQNKVKKILKAYKNEELNKHDYQTWQNLIILTLCSGIFIPPRRLEIAYIKYKNIKPNEDNFIINNEITFNIYKTSKFLGKQVIELPAEATNIIKMFIKYNKIHYPNNDYLLIDSNKNHLSNTQLNQRINKIFNGRHISVNQFRHQYLTDKYGDVNLKEMKQTAEAMGKQNIEGVLEYVKK